MVVLGIVTALAVQALIILREHLRLGPTLTISLIAIAAGLVGAKVWFLVLHRKEHRFEGWCIQGFLLGVAVGAIASLAAFHTPVGAFLDVASPGLFFGLAIGRIGCFFAGCCSGRPTASRWGIWSSDQRVGMRRIPTQFLELGVALGIALAASAAILTYGPMGGGIFVAALSAYTLCRQGLLRIRVERRRSALGGPLTALVAALVLVGDALILALRAS
jgi:phosphatidylglycerol:prolipoprotein diacylglycerol transferase